MSLSVNTKTIRSEKSRASKNLSRVSASRAFESLETRRMLSAAVVPAYASKIGLTNLIDSTPTFVDEFNGTNLDSTKWQIREGTRWHETTSSSSPMTYTTAASVKVSNGNLELIAHNNPTTGRLESGWIQTSYNSSTGKPSNLVDGRSAQFDQKFGYWEARMSFGSVSGMWSALWVQSQGMTAVGENASKANHPEIYGTEMDIAESGAIRGGSNAAGSVSSVIHASGYGSYHRSAAVHTNVKGVAGSDPSQFHVYGMLWTDKSVQFYVDGNLVNKITDPAMVSKAKQTTILSNEIGAPSGSSYFGSVPKGGYGSVATSKAKLTVDYVHVWALKGSGSSTSTPPSTTPPSTTPPTTKPPIVVPPVVTPPGVKRATVTGYVYNDSTTSKGATKTGLAGKTVYVDTNKNGKLDSNEQHTTTNSKGAYTLTNVAPGTVVVRQVLTSGTYQSQPMTLASQTLKLTSGKTAILNFMAAKSPLVTPASVSASLTGSIYIDRNLNNRRDGNDYGVANIVVYLDANNNGKRDANELYTKTDSSGGYYFNKLEAGSYSFRLELTKTKYQQKLAGDTIARRIDVTKSKHFDFMNYRVEKK